MKESGGYLPALLHAAEQDEAADSGKARVKCVRGHLQSPPKLFQSPPKLLPVLSTPHPMFPHRCVTVAGAGQHRA